MLSNKVFRRCSAPSASESTPDLGERTNFTTVHAIPQKTRQGDRARVKATDIRGCTQTALPNDAYTFSEPTTAQALQANGQVFVHERPATQKSKHTRTRPRAGSHVTWLAIALTSLSPPTPLGRASRGSLYKPQHLSYAATHLIGPSAPP